MQFFYSDFTLWVPNDMVESVRYILIKCLIQQYYLLYYLLDKKMLLVTEILKDIIVYNCGLIIPPPPLIVQRLESPDLIELKF